jgi:hypothetical protein
MRRYRALVVVAMVVVAFAAVAVGLCGRAEAAVGADMAAAAERLAGSMQLELAAKLTFKFGDGERLNWHFIPRDRKGVAFKEMNPQQRELGLGLIRSGLSEHGYKKVTDIMDLEILLGQREAVARNLQWDPGLYYITFFGRPSMTGSWGWRLEGHHLSLNYTLTDGRVVSVTPAFFGANPAEVSEGKWRGLRALAQE